VTLVVTCVDDERCDGLGAADRVDLRFVATPVVPDGAALEKIGDAIVRERNAIKQTQLAIEHLLLPAESAMYEASERLCATSDLVIGHYFLYTLGAAADNLLRPHVSVVLAHGAIPSAHQPPPGIPDLGGLGNRLTWRLARSVLNRAFKKYPDRLRAQHGIAAARDMIDDVWASEYLTLLAVSPTICERRPDWPSHYRVCGALDTRDDAGGGIPERLRSFLSAGVSPVYMTFGSMMAGSDERRTIALLAAAAQAASARAIIQAPSWDRLGFASNSRVLFVDRAPHAAVFPLCSAVVHHGGAGTSQAALRAGVPSVIVPHTAEQELWGRELQRIGVAYESIPRRGASPERIAAAIEQVTRSEHVRDTARTMGTRVAKEDGVAVAVRLIAEKFAS
jgi:sterol 3beta-glucosyltransferase/vancomycin aglycone glucosyltransferase